MDKILRKAELSGAIIVGAGIQYPRTADVYIGDDKNGYERGDLVDANAVIDIVDNGDTQDQKDIKKLREDLTVVENKIPEEASSSNQLADKAYVNSGIATNSATFKGTYQSVSELDNVEADNNDYAFVVRTDSQGNSYYDRYKYVEDTGWEYEFTIENTQFSQAQLDAINSGATSAKIQKLDRLAEYDGEFIEVAQLPTPSDETIGKVYMIPANPNVVVNWDWQNNIPSAIRAQWVEGVNATGTINSDLTGIVLSIGPKVADTNVKFSTNGGLDNVQVNTNTYVRIPIKDAGDTIHFVCVQNHHQFTINGDAAQSDDFTYIASLQDKANGYVEIVSTGYCNFYRIVVTHTVITRAAGMDSARNTRDKYVTVLRGNTYVWEQIESAYINLDDFYTKNEVDGIASEIAQSAEQNLIDDERVVAFALNDLDQRINVIDDVASEALNESHENFNGLVEKVTEILNSNIYNSPLYSSVGGAPTEANVPDNWREDLMGVWTGAPLFTGQEYIDKVNKKLYKCLCTPTNSTGDWKVIV